MVVGKARRAQRGAALLETLVVLLALGPMVLGGMQMLLFYQARSIVNYATFEAARYGAVKQGRIAAMEKRFAEAIVPLYGGGVGSAETRQGRVLRIMGAFARARADVLVPAGRYWRGGAGFRLERLHPTAACFEDFAVEIGGVRQIPNDHLRFRSHTARGARSGVTIQDANLLKIKVVYGYRLFVPVINRLIASVMWVVDPGNRRYYVADPPRLPIVATATVRMQSPAVEQ